MDVERILDIIPTGFESGVWIGKYDEAKKEMESFGFSEIDLAINAMLRREYGSSASISENRNRVREDILVLPGKKSRLTRSSVISTFPELATVLTLDEFCLDFPESEIPGLKQAYEMALEDSVVINAESIPTDKFEKSRIAIYAFGTTHGKNLDKDKEDARLYGEFLRKLGILEMLILVPESGSRPFVRKVEFWNLKKDLFDSNTDIYRSALGCRRGLNVADCRVRGVRQIYKPILDK